MTYRSNALRTERKYCPSCAQDGEGPADSGEPPDPGATLPRTISPLQNSYRTFQNPPFDKPRLTFPISDQTRQFISEFYPEVSWAQWNDWKWQVRNRVLRIEQLERFIDLTGQERRAILKKGFPVAITPYYLSLLSRDDPSQPLRRTHVPREDGFVKPRQESIDPLGEDHDMVVPGLVHRYPDRVLFLTTDFCPTYCRYCTRSRMVGKTAGDGRFNINQWERAIEYIAEHPQIRDCLLSGGDVLSLGDDKLQWLLTRLRAIPHLEFIRIGTKVPAVLPQRVTRALCNMLKAFHPLWMSIHFTHPDELTPETQEACTRLADAGIPLGSQTVLLKDINDNAETLKALFQGLLRVRVKPYYLYQCDPVAGSEQFRTPVEKGLEIIRQLRGHTTGYAAPQYVIDAPGGGGKIPLQPDYVAGRDQDDLLLINFEGKTFRYPDPAGRVGLLQQNARQHGADYDQSTGVYRP